MEQKTIHEQPLRGLRILVADDKFLIAVTIEETLRDAGAEILSAATLPAALKTANEEQLSAALLDVRLGRQTSEAVADALAARAVPFVFYSGQSLPDRMRLRLLQGVGGGGGKSVSSCSDDGGPRVMKNGLVFFLGLLGAIAFSWGGLVLGSH